MTDRLSEGLNPEEIRKLEQQAKSLAGDFAKPIDRLIGNSATSSQTSNDSPEEFRIDPETGKRYRVVNHLLEAANIKARKGGLTPYVGIRIPNRLIKYS